MKLYQYISLVAAKLVGRRHNRDVDPPGLKELKNAFVSKSDSAITVRPDFNPIAEDLLAVSDGFVTTRPDDFLNSATGIYGTDNLIYFSNNTPISWDGATAAVAASNYTTGTVTATSGQAVITGSGTSWVQNAWPGCYIEINGDGKYYKVETVDANTSLTITENLTDSYTAKSYVINKTHNPDHAAYKLNIQPFTSGAIYSCPTITMPVDAKKICGPFYASVVEITTDEVWVALTDDDVAVDTQSATDVAKFQQLATDGTNWLGYFGTLAGVHIWAKSSDPSDDWEAVTGPANFTPSTHVSYYNSKFYIAGRNTSTGRAAYAYTSDVGDNWTVRDHDSDVNTAWAVAVNTAGRVVITVNNSGAGIFAYYTDNDGTGWTACTPHAVSSPYTFQTAYFINSTFVLSGNAYAAQPNYYYSADGATFSAGALTSSSLPHKVAYSTSGDFWVFQTQVDVCIVSELGGGYTSRSFPAAGGFILDVVWAGDKFFTPMTLPSPGVYSTTDFSSYELVSTPSGALNSGAYSYVSRETVFLVVSSSFIKLYISNQTQTTTEWRAATFEPLSDEYRALSHSVLDGYVMLLGLREFQSTTNSWEYYPRRIRWSTPLTYNDFSSSGSGAADLDGSGALLDSRTVNGRIVTFESSSIGSISPRGYASDPWEYDRIKDNIRAISNPVVVDDMCYFIDDSGLLRATNGISVESPPFSFDLTEYDDFNADSPIWLTYSPELESLVVFNPSAADKYVYLIETEEGGVSRIELKTVINGSSANLTPKSVVCVENSSDRRLFVTYNPIAADTTKLVVSELSTGDTITGKDEWTSEAGDDTYHSTVFETGEIYLVPEGQKTSIKHVIVRTYTNGSTLATNPVVGVQVRSLEDTAWHCAGDTNGTISVDTNSCDGTSTAWSNTLDATTTPVFTTPCLATQARIYVGSSVQTLGTHYTITGTKEITFGAAPSGTVYAYWENVPEVKVAASDLISTTDGYHRISSVTDQNSIVLDHYPQDTGEDFVADAAAIHIPAGRIPNGDGEVKIGLNKLVEGVRIRVIVMHDASGDATVTKVTGMVVGHVPCGEKIVEP